MALDIDVKKKIRNSLDYECGGRLNATANTAVALDAPVLIVGLGGTGADAVIRVKKLISDRMKGDTKNIEYFVLYSTSLMFRKCSIIRFQAISIHGSTKIYHRIK